ncbi:hypothetical protein ANTPLA_LOCUS10977 [Anthophora plagiata]
MVRDGSVSDGEQWRENSVDNRGIDNRRKGTCGWIRRAMKLPLRFVTSFLLISVGVNSWPYHGIVGVGQSVYVAPVYEVAPAVRLLPTELVKEVQATVVAGPVTGTTIVEGSSSGPVTILSPGTSSKIPQTDIATTTKIDVSDEVEDSVLIKGASAGPVTLVAPSDGSVVAIAETNNATSASAETKKGAVAASASAEATVAIENAEESSETSANVTTINETVGIASAKAVIGPSTGPIIIAGPTAPPLPVATVPTATDKQSATVATSNATSSVSVASSAVANASVSATVTVEGTDNGSENLADATELTRIEGSASSSSLATSGSSAASASAKVNLITPTIAVTRVPLSNLVVSAAAAPSALVSGPSGTISAGSAASLLLKPPLYTL